MMLILLLPVFLVAILKMLIKKPYLMVFWFLPIFNGMLTVSYAEIGISHYITYLQLGLVLLGLFFCIITSTTTRLSSGVLFILILLSFSMLYSEIKEYQLVFYLMGYALMVHMLVKKYPYEVWSQYYFICLVIVFLSFVDFISFFILDDFIISYRTPEVIGIGLPRINTIFDEMSHQAFFMMPAVIFSLVNSLKSRYLLLFGMLITMSAAALILFTITLLVYLPKNLLHNLKSYSPAIIIVGLALFLGYDFIIGKMISIFVNDSLISGEFTKNVSALNILLGIEILKFIPLNDLFFGYGFFGLAENVPQLLYDSDFYQYFLITEALDEPQAVGIINLVLYFGLFLCCLVVLLLFKIKKYANDAWLYKLVILVVFLSLIKSSSTVEYLVHLFFMFGLSWASTHPLSEYASNRYSNKILN